jgi:hypothetical protein
MGVQQVRLESVRRKSGGRIHLTPRVPSSGPVTTLCGQTLAEGTYQAVARRPTPPPAPSPPADKKVDWPAAKPPPEVVPEQVGELTTRGFRPSGEGVWRSPGGVIVRMKRHGKEWRFEELVFEGSVVATRTRDGLKIRAGDVEVTPSDEGFDVQLKKK